MKRRVEKQTWFRFLIRVFIDLQGVFQPVKKVKVENNGKKILIFNWRDTKHAYAGGAEVYIQELAKRWIKNGDEVTLFCGSDGKSRRNEIVDGIRIYRRGGFYFVYVWAFLYYLVQFRGKYDIIIDCENGIPFFTPLYSTKKKFLVIHHVHQEIFRKNLRFPLAMIASFLEAKLMPLLYRNVQIITVSPSSKQEIIKHKLTADEPSIIYNGIDHAIYMPGIKAESPLVLYIGRLQAYKSLPVFLHAAKRILRQVPETRFVIAGDGEARDSLKVLVKTLGLSDYVTFRGHVSESEKVSLLQKAWVVINPSLREGWGITTIEANACGTPVVASNVSGLKDSIQNNRTGFLVPYGDVKAFSQKTTTLLTEHTLREELSKASIAWANNYNWDSSAQSFNTIMSASDLPSPRQVPARKFSYYINKVYSILF